ncbi:hypothetical protein M408DRAFT_93398 [Serendipita vermifera MAFF 305830]|uniref:Uncharacterized protein n=1 Tax=Serendipita vermifera MAFF 305830 TaxID=933852 RepID=A0A0C2X891_SERVB|nr:hypothetical protein M408DRAFT_93398 [Serendipita vermifera MAFF 305830]
MASHMRPHPTSTSHLPYTQVVSSLKIVSGIQINTILVRALVAILVSRVPFDANFRLIVGMTVLRKCPRSEQASEYSDLTFYL